jgi:hypothetical protein
VRTAAREHVHVERTFGPSAARAAYDELYALYRGLQDALRPTHTTLAGIRRHGAFPSTT